MMAVLCTDGQLSLSDVHKECGKQKWIPLLVYRIINEDSIYLPVFSIEETARSFIKRNLPKKWVHAGIWLSVTDLEKIKSSGWNIEHFSFPRKICEKTDIKLGFEIHEFMTEPDFNYGRL
jgi:hypothetical protein